MAYTIKTTKAFDKDMERCIKRGYPMEELRKAMKLLERDGFLPTEYKPHKLHGDRQGQWECHIQHDWLLIWERLRVGELARECSTTRNSSSLCSTRAHTLTYSAKSIRNN